MSKLVDLLLTDSPSIYYDSKFRQVMEDHIPYMIENNMYDVMTINDGQAYKYENDFYGLLVNSNIDPNLHWITMRLNGLLHPGEYQQDQLTIKVPDRSVVNDILRMYRLYT